MSNQFGFLSDETFAQKMDVQNQMLAAIVAKQGGNAIPTSWKEVQALVRVGLHQNVFHIGDQLVCQRNGQDMVWDVIGIDHDIPSDPQFQHSMTLQLRNPLPSPVINFDVPKALYYCETALPAGTYNFTIPLNYDVEHGGGKTYQFTLTNEVPVGGQICFSWGYGKQASSSLINVYSSCKDANVLEQIPIIEGNGGINLGTADGTGQNMNDIQYVRYGVNRWENSTVRQWLNNETIDVSSWTPLTKFDRPLIVTNNAGFLRGMDEDFLAVLGNTMKMTVFNETSDMTNYSITQDKMFLLSKTEIFAGNEYQSFDEGSPYPYYANYSDHSIATSSADGNRIKYQNASAQRWWLRTPTIDYGGLRYVSVTGGIGNLLPYSIEGKLAPACNII